MVKNFTMRASEQKDAPLESPLRVSEQKDASLESPFGVSEQKDAPLESPTAVSVHQRPLKCFPTAAPLGHWLSKCFPTMAPLGHWPLKCFPMAAPSGQRPPKCFPMAANEWRSPLSAGRVGAYCIRPRCSKQETAACVRKAPINWFPTAAPSGYWPLKCFSMAANEWRSPLSAGRVGRKSIRPQMFQTRNGSVWLEGALKCNCPCWGIGWGVCNTPLPLGTPSGYPPIKWFPTAAPSGHWPQKCFPTVALSGHLLLKWFPTAAPSGHWLLKCFPTAANEWKLPLSAGRVGAYCIRPQTIRTRNSSVWLEGALICNCPCRGIGWGVCNTPLLLGTPLGHPPIKWFPTRANEWRSPLSVGRVGRKSIRPQTIRTGNDSVWPQGAYKMVSNGSAFGSFALEMFSNGSAFGSAAPIIFFRENCNKRRASASQWVETT